MKTRKTRSRMWALCMALMMVTMLALTACGGVNAETQHQGSGNMAVEEQTTAKKEAKSDKKTEQQTKPSAQTPAAQQQTTQNNSGNSSKNNNSGSNSSGSNKKSGHWETRVVTPAWDEQVITGYKTVVDQEAWDEPRPYGHNEMHNYCYCGFCIDGLSDAAAYAHHEQCGYWGNYIEPTWVQDGMDYAHHDAVTHQEPIYETVHHEAVTEQVWVED